ncbi:MAG: glycosyltransferase family 9 protein [Betaproteobacteria bacterium]|nr:MAG: glycosyltransferase family 9 protein [Betaproteobacteria bacterium]
MSGAATSGPRILVIRRENIGDLICTTPLLRALRAQLPGAWIGALVTRYNAPVLAGNPDLDQVFSYQKAKHRTPEESLTGIYWRRLKTIAELRALRCDWVLLPGGPHASALRFAKWISPVRTLVRGPEAVAAGPHEVEQACSLLAGMGLRVETPPARLAAAPAECEALAARVREHLGWRPERIVAIHISARKPSQRWVGARFAELIRRLPAPAGSAFMLLWAPGSERNPRHPGDDEKAAQIEAALRGVPLVPIATRRLEELIAALALCERVICADGGAMHLAAALGKPMVCLFGDSDAARWGPWRTVHELLQPPSRNVADIMVEDVMQAYGRLCARNPSGT